MHRRWFSTTVAFVSGLLLAGIFAVAAARPERWWSPGEGRVFPATLDYENAAGTLRTLVVDGPLETKAIHFSKPSARMAVPLPPYTSRSRKVSNVAQT